MANTLPITQIVGTVGVDFAIQIQTSGGSSYYGKALPGTALATAAWQCFKQDASGNITWADGNNSFDNVATTMSALTYS